MGQKLSYLAVRGPLKSVLNALPEGAEGSVVSSPPWTVIQELGLGQAEDAAGRLKGLAIAVDVHEGYWNWSLFVDGKQRANMLKGGADDATWEGVDAATTALGVPSPAVSYVDDDPWGFLTWLSGIGVPDAPVVGDLKPEKGFVKRGEAKPKGWWATPMAGGKEGVFFVPEDSKFDARKRVVQCGNKSIKVAAGHRPIVGAPKAQRVWDAILDPNSKKASEASWQAVRQDRVAKAKRALTGGDFEAIAKVYITLRTLKAGGEWLSPIEAENLRRTRAWTVAECQAALNLEDAHKALKAAETAI